MILTANSQFTIGAGHIVISSGAGAFTMNGEIRGRGTFTNDSGNLFTINSTILHNGFNGAMLMQGSGNTLVNGLIGTLSGTVNVTKNGAGTVTLANASSSYAGTTTVNAGTLVVANNAPSGAAGALGSATSAVKLGLAGSNDSASIFTGGAFTVGRNIEVQSSTNAADGTTTRVLNVGGNTAHNSVFSGSLILGTSGATNIGRGVTLSAVTSGEVTFSGVIQNPSLFVAGTQGTVTKSGAGKVILSNANTYTGNTTVEEGTLEATVENALQNTAAVKLTGGTLLLKKATGGAANMVNNSAAFTLNGGRLDLDSGDSSAITEEVGTLTLSANSIIDLNAIGTLKFAASNSLSWTGGTTLSIYNWMNNSSSVGLFFGTSSAGLTSGQLSQIKLYSGEGTGLQTGTATLDSFGEVTLTPIPEPTTVLAVLLLGLFIAHRERRSLSVLLFRMRSLVR